MSGDKPRGYLLYCNVKLAKDQKETLKYYIGLPTEENKRGADWVYTIKREYALRFKDNQIIGKFISKNLSALKNIKAPFWEKVVYIEDVDHNNIIVDTADLSKF